MNPKWLIPVLAFVVLVGLTLYRPCLAPGGEITSPSGYKILEPIRHGNLTIFPVVAAKSYNTQEFLTLDEGLRSGEVIVTESGNAAPLVRPRHSRPLTVPDGPRGGGAQVNQLVLINNSKRPLILLAGEIVTGGKQDRVIGKDRIVPQESDPIDLSVFCVEPGRWTGASVNFNSMNAPMAQPAVRGNAMGETDQAQVWSEVGKTKAAMSETVEVTGEASALDATSSYARVMQNPGVAKQVDSIAEPIQRSYLSLIRQLRDQNAVGVVVAVNGQIVWADVFASTSLLEKYWPKLARSYAAEAVVAKGRDNEPSVKQAQEFLARLDGRHETVDSEPGLYRHTEITGDSFRVFELTSLLPNTGFDLHLAKMAE
jgi:hypothetical protein